MKHAGLVAAALALATAPALWADARPNPYVSIVERNPFAIKPTPPTPPPAEPAAPLVPPAKVVLTGVTSIIGPPRALLEITETEPGKQPTVTKGVAKVGERVGAIEVLSIDVEHNSVRIRNGNIETNVMFEVAKQSSPAGPAPPPGLMPPSAALPSPTGFPTAAAVPQVFSRGGGEIPGRAGSGVASFGAEAPAVAAGPSAYANSSASPSSYSSANRLNSGVGTYGSGDQMTRPLRTDPRVAQQPTAMDNYVNMETLRHEVGAIAAQHGYPPPLLPSTPISEHAAAAAGQK